MIIPATFSFRALIPHFGVIGSGLAVMTVALMLAFVSLWSLKETFDDDLDYIEKA